MSTYDFEPNPEDYGPEPAHIANGTQKKNLLVTPPKREWVGLSEEEIRAMDAGLNSNASFYAGALWAEAKLKEKNT